MFEVLLIWAAWRVSDERGCSEKGGCCGCGQVRGTVVRLLRDAGGLGGWDRQRMGAAPERILHVAESLFHDHVPAKKLGLDTAWVHRRAVKGGFGATPRRRPPSTSKCLTSSRWSSPSGLAGRQPGYVSSHLAISSSFRLESDGRRRGLRKRTSRTALLVM